MKNLIAHYIELSTWIINNRYVDIDLIAHYIELSTGKQFLDRATDTMFLSLIISSCLREEETDEYEINFILSLIISSCLHECVEYLGDDNTYRSLYRAVYLSGRLLRDCFYRILSLIISSCLLVENEKNLLLGSLIAHYIELSTSITIQESPTSREESYRSLYRAVYERDCEHGKIKR